MPETKRQSNFYNIYLGKPTNDSQMPQFFRNKLCELWKIKRAYCCYSLDFFFLAKYKQVCCKGPGMTCSGEGSKSVKYSIKNYKWSIDTLLKVLLYLLNSLIVTLTHSGMNILLITRFSGSWSATLWQRTEIPHLNTLPIADTQYLNYPVLLTSGGVASWPAIPLATSFPGSLSLSFRSDG